MNIVKGIDKWLKDSKKITRKEIILIIFGCIGSFITGICLYDYTTNNKKGLNNIISLTESILEINIPLFVIIIFILVINSIKAILKKRKNNQIEDNTSDGKNNNDLKIINDYTIDIENETEIVVNGKTLDSRILNYTQDIIEGTKFSWKYSITSSGYKIIDLKFLCPICGQVQVEDHTGYEDITVICYDCYLTEDGFINNVNASSVYEDEEYRTLKKLAKTIIISRAFSIKKNYKNEDTLKCEY